MNSDLKNRLLKNSTIEFTSSLEKSELFTEKEMVHTTVPMINVALSGSVEGGLLPGLLMLAAPSKHFKTGLALLLASSFLNKYSDGIVLFYDSEFGSPGSYFDTFKVARERVVHSPILDVEQLKFDLVKQLSEIQRNDKVLIIIDSLGSLASKKEVDDALNEKSVSDMTRAKQFKSLFRMTTPQFTLKNIPCIVVNHTYKEIGLYPKDIVGGGTGSYYSSNDIWLIGRQQDKEGTEVQGYNFIIKIEKSRTVKEGSKIPISVSFDYGINRWSGLLDIALEGNYVVKPKNGWYAIVDRNTGEPLAPSMREADIIDNKEIWENMFRDTDFAKYIENKYKMVTGKILEEEL